MHTFMFRSILSLFASLCFCFVLDINQCHAEELQNTKNVVSDEYFNDDYFEDDYNFSDDDSSYDKDTFRAWNVFWFHVNDFALMKVAKPLHEGYSKITTSGMRSGIENFRHNLNSPIRMVNALLQAEFGQFFVELGRFIVNTTTSLGFADVAGVNNKPLVPYDPEHLRFGSTLATWGVPEGPYFVIPFLGPSTVREAIGTGVDAVSCFYDYALEWYVAIPTEVFLLFNNIDSAYKPYEMITKNAIEPYSAVRNAYLENLNFKTPYPVTGSVTETLNNPE